MREAGARSEREVGAVDATGRRRELRTTSLWPPFRLSAKASRRTAQPSRRLTRRAHRRRKEVKDGAEVLRARLTAKVAVGAAGLKTARIPRRAQRPLSLLLRRRKTCHRASLRRLLASRSPQPLRIIKRLLVKLRHGLPHPLGQSLPTTCHPCQA